MDKILSSKYIQKLLQNAIEAATDAPKTASRKGIQKTEDTTGHLIGKNISHKTTKASKNLPQNTSETVERKTKIPRKRYISSNSFK